MLNLTDVRVRSLDLDYLDVFWDSGAVFEDPLDYSFVVLRSENETGPYSAVSGDIRDGYHFRDTSVRGMHRIYHKIYYRVRVTHRVSGEFAEFPSVGGAALGARPNLYSLEAARIERLRLKAVDGRLVWLFSRRSTGQKCTVCFDHATQRRTRSNCMACFDTGFVGGYYAPVPVWAQVTTAMEATTHGKAATIEMQNTSFRMGNFPELSMGDVIVEAENVRWRIPEVIQKTTISRALVRQQCSLHRIPSTDIEYKLPVNLDAGALATLEATPEWGYTNSTDLTNVSAAKAKHSVFSGNNR